MYKSKRISFSMLFVLAALFNRQPARADFNMGISINGPASPLFAGDFVNLDFVISFDSDDPLEHVNSISFDNFLTTPEITDLSRFAAENGFWIGAFDPVNGDASFTADVGNEIFDSNAPKTIGRITINTLGLAPGTYSLEIQSTAWLVTGLADGQVNLYDSINGVAGSGNSITFPAPVSFTIQTVPEPSSIMLLAVSCLGCLVQYRRYHVRRQCTARSSWP